MNADSPQRLYETLALRCDRAREARQRDIFLVLAADAALSAGHVDDAERLRTRLLEMSPHSLLRPYVSMTDALRSSDIHDYVADLRRLYPPEEAIKLIPEKNAVPREPPRAEPAPVLRPRDESPRVATVPPRPIPAAPRREQTASPYARLDTAVPAETNPEAGGAWLATLICVVVAVAAAILTIYVTLRPWLR